MSKNKKKNRNGDYRLLIRMIYIKAALWTLGFTAGAFLIYVLFLRGRFADKIVNALDYFIYHDYYEALSIYEYYFRNNLPIFILIAIALFGLISLVISVRGFTKYFNEINNAIDSLIDDDTEDVILSKELSATEEKINSIKHTLVYRKLAAESAENRKNDLVMYLAHDLKTPLTSVIGYLTLLRDENKISDELREKYLSISLEKAERLEDLINEFFEITRFNLSDITLEYSTINLTRMLEQLTYEFKPMLDEKNLKICLNATPDIMLKCDVNKLQRVFDNLLRNAVNYSFQSSTIDIICMVSDEKINIDFTNRGNTITTEKLERIFTQFYRLDTSRSSANGGAGLGLAIAKQIVELHGGEITAFSENEIVRFTVTLPL